jgi:hypothetical protein
MILIEPSELGIANLKLLLLCFENMSELKINFGKSESLVMGVPEPDKLKVANMLNCRLGKFPISYLGMPVSDKKLLVADWDFLTEKVGHG